MQKVPRLLLHFFQSNHVDLLLSFAPMVCVLAVVRLVVKNEYIAFCQIEITSDWFKRFTWN